MQLKVIFLLVVTLILLCFGGNCNVLNDAEKILGTIDSSLLEESDDIRYEKIENHLHSLTNPPKYDPDMDMANMDATDMDDSYINAVNTEPLNELEEEKENNLSRFQEVKLNKKKKSKRKKKTKKTKGKDNLKPKKTTKVKDPLPTKKHGSHHHRHRHHNHHHRRHHHHHQRHHSRHRKHDDHQSNFIPKAYADTVKSILFTEEQIAEAVSKLADQINKDYANKENVLMVGLLNGSFVFVADLLRKVDIKHKLDFMVVSSYGSGTVTSGNIKVKKDVSIDPYNAHILILEDLIDTGHTLTEIVRYLEAKKAASVKICCLLNKHGRREKDVPIDYVGLECPNEFVIGYGMDFNNEYRSLPFVGVLKESAYQ